MTTPPPLPGTRHRLSLPSSDSAMHTAAAAVEAATELLSADSVVAAEIVPAPGSASAAKENSGELLVTAVEQTKQGSFVESTLSAPGLHIRTTHGTTGHFPADESQPTADLHCPGSRGWQAALTELLHADDGFADLVETYDGCIGVSIAGRPTHVRCYRGDVLEVTGRSLRGADFLVEIPGDTFVEMMQAGHNDFMERAMTRQMSSTGSGYEYLRMTTALIRLNDHARTLARRAGWPGTNHPTGTDHPTGTVTSTETVASTQEAS